MNRLKINNDKNKMIIINKPKWDNIFKNFSFKAGKEIVKAKYKIKILGIWIQNDLKMDSEINKLSSNLHNRINNINKISKYTDFRSRLNFINSFVIGKMIYMLPLYNNLPLYLRNKLHKIQMKSARTAIGNYCYKKSTSYILNKCKWLNINNMIKYSSLVFIHNVIYNKNQKVYWEYIEQIDFCAIRLNYHYKISPKILSISNSFFKNILSHIIKYLTI